MGSFIDSFDPLKGLDQVSSPASKSVPGSSLLSGIMGGGASLPPMNITAPVRADSRAASSAVVDFSSGSFSVGGSKSTNMLLIVAGVVALAFLFSNRRGKR